MSLLRAFNHYIRDLYTKASCGGESATTVEKAIAVEGSEAFKLSSLRCNDTHLRVKCLSMFDRNRLIEQLVEVLWLLTTWLAEVVLVIALFLKTFHPTLRDISPYWR